MKNKINITISKDTPTEMFAAFCDVLKKSEKSKPKQPLYALNEDIEKLHERYEQLFKQVKSSLNLSANQIKKECETLSRKYDFDLEELSKIGKIEYDKRQAAIKAKAAEETPFRRCWLWRLLLRPLTNRAQDIIEERAQLDADKIHSAAEKQLDDDYEKLEQEYNRKPTKRDLRQKLEAAIEAADKADVREAFDEPPTVPATSENVAPLAEPMHVQARQELTPVEPEINGQLPGQMTLDDVQPPVQPARRPRPPRNCRKPPTQGQ